MKKEFYKSVKDMDSFFEASLITDGIVNKVIMKLRNKSAYQYFFWRLDNPKWLENELFSAFIKTNLTSIDTQRASLAAHYLAKPTIIESSQSTIYKIIKTTKISDSNIKWIILGIISKMDSKYIAKLIPNVRLLIQKNIPEHDILSVIVEKLIEGKRKKSVMLLLEYITKPKKEILSKEIKKEINGAKINNAKSIMGEYEFREFIKTVSPKLKESFPVDTAKIFTKNLIRCFEIETSKKYKEDYSWIWRSAIEEHEQNYNFGKYNEVITSALRDVLESISKNSYKPFIKNILKEYIKSPYSIFRRLALHISRVNYEDNKQFVESIISDYRYFNDYRIKHEYSLLLRDHFSSLSEKTRAHYLEWIDNGPDIEKYKSYQKKHKRETTDAGIKSYQDYWRYERLWVIRKHLPDRTENIEGYRKQFNEPKHADLPSWHEETIGGYESPLSIKQVSTLSGDILVQLFKYPPNVSEERHFQYFGFAKVFEEVVKIKLLNEGVYFIDPSLMANDDIAPIFIAHYFQGISAASKEEQIDWPSSLTQLAFYVVNRKTETHSDSRGKYARARYDLVSLIEDLLRNRERLISAELLQTLRDILIGIVGEKDSSIQDEISKPKEDWSFVALNSTSGKVIHSLFQYALRFALDNEHSIGDHQSKLDPKIKEVFEKVLIEEKRPSVRSVFGMYLANLWYLDADWAKSQVNQLFPANDRIIRKAVWDSYLQFNHLYKDIYESIIDEYKRTINELDPKSEQDRSSGKLAEHISLIYLRGWDNFRTNRSITKPFIKQSQLLHRNQFIWRIERALEEVKARDTVEVHAKVWKLSKQYWQWRVENIKPKQELENHQDELTGFLGWLEYAPKKENIVALFPLIKKTLIKRNPLVSDHKFTEYLANSSKEHPLEAIQLYYYYYMLDHDNYRHYADEKCIRIVMDNALKAGVQGRKWVGNFANRLGEIGLFVYKEYWELSRSIKISENK